MTELTISETTLASIPHRRSRKDVVVLRFGGTTVGATKEQGRVKLARHTIVSLIKQDKFVVPVFSAYRRGRSGSEKKLCGMLGIPMAPNRCRRQSTKIRTSRCPFACSGAAWVGCSRGRRA